MSVKDVCDYVTAAQEMITVGDTAGAQRHRDRAARHRDPGRIRMRHSVPLWSPRSLS